MVPIKLGKNVLTGSYTNFSRIALVFLKYFLLDVQTTFKLMTCMNCIREESQKHHLFPRKFCGHRSLENSESVTRVIEIWENLRKYFEWLQLRKIFSKHDKRFIQIRTFLGLNATQAMLHFSLTIGNDIEPLLVLFQVERPSVFYMKS